MRERVETETETQTDRQTDRQTDTDRQTEELILVNKDTILYDPLSVILCVDIIIYGIICDSLQLFFMSAFGFCYVSN